MAPYVGALQTHLLYWITWVTKHVEENCLASPSFVICMGMAHLYTESSSISIRKKLGISRAAGVWRPTQTMPFCQHCPCLWWTSWLGFARWPRVTARGVWAKSCAGGGELRPWNTVWLVVGIIKSKRFSLNFTIFSRVIILQLINDCGMWLVINMFPLSTLSEEFTGWHRKRKRENRSLP